MRLCVLGDELVAGTGDPRALGWVGRVLARSSFPTAPMVMPLAVPGETTKEMSERWDHEVAPRVQGSTDNRLIIAVGCADAVAGVSTPRTRLHLANIADAALGRGIQVFFVGPPPLAGVQSTAVAELSAAVADVAHRRGLPFVNCFDPLVANEQWFEDMASSEARSDAGLTLPAQAGYGLLAWLVLHQGWYEWSASELRA